MKKTKAAIYLVLTLFFIVSTALEAGFLDRLQQVYWGRSAVCTPCIRLLIAHDVPEACLEVCGKYSIVDPNTRYVIASRVHGKRRPVCAGRDGIKWGEEFPDIYQIKLIPTNCQSCILVNDIPYYGSITIYDVGGSISIVNELDIEDYVISSLAAKLDRPLAPEALNALVIAQRTDAYYRSTYPCNPYWDVDGLSFEYRGKETLAQTMPVQHAVEATRYMVVSRPKGGLDPHIGPHYIHLFPAKWRYSENGYDPAADGPQLIVAEAEEQADQGKNAAQIMQQVWPGVVVQRMCYVP